MALIVAGRFTTFDKANEVAQKLHMQQIAQEDVSIFFVTPPGQHAQFPIGGDEFADAAARPAGKGVRQGIAAGAILGLLVGGLVYFAVWRYWLIPVVAALIGAYAGSLTGALGKMQPAPQQGGRRRLRKAGVMLATRVDASRAPLVARLLGEGGAEDIEQTDGIWRDGKWQDFDPVTAPNVQGRPSPPSPKQR